MQLLKKTNLFLVILVVTLGEAKSLFTSMYLYLNSVAAKKASIFDNLLAENFNDLEEVAPKKLNYKDCIKAIKKT